MGKENRFLSIDLETTGLDPEWCSILEIGIVIADWHSCMDDLPTFRCFLDSDDYRGRDTVTRQPYYYGTSYALWLNAEIFKYLAMKPKDNEEAVKMGFEEYVPILQPCMVGKEIAGFLRAHNFDLRDHLTAAGKNFGSFDAQFLKLLGLGDDNVVFRHRAIDPAMYYWEPDTDGNRLPGMKQCMERAGLPGEVPHTAVEDAKIVVKLIRQARVLGRIPGKQIK